jgi:hypothetical protein
MAIVAAMETASIMNALKMAAKQKVNSKACTINHFARGLQYCSKESAKMDLKSIDLAGRLKVCKVAVPIYVPKITQSSTN